MRLVKSTLFLVLWVLFYAGLFLLYHYATGLKSS
jgi:hypothetical protein